jgi:hypothetical protein
MKRFVIILSLIIGYGCAGMNFTFAPIPDKDTTEAKLYAEKCSLCHSVPHPNRYVYDRWEEIVFNMEDAMKEKGMTELKENERSIILNYLKVHSRK